MGYANLAEEPDADWFVLMDDDSLPFVDNIARWLATFPNPRKSYYFIHGPGERRSGNRLGNGGGGFYVSRKLMEDTVNTTERCVLGMAKRVLNGDIRFDTCLRRFLDRFPDFVTAAFHLDPKVLRGDLTGFVEGFVTRVGLLSLHHIEKVKFQLFPKKFMKEMTALDANINQKIMFIRSVGALGSNFLRRSAVKTIAEQIVILNEGYSMVVLPDLRIDRALTYLLGVEETFRGTPVNLYGEMSRYVIRPNTQIQRYYIRNIKKEKDVVVQEYGLFLNISQTVTVVRKGDVVTFLSDVPVKGLGSFDRNK
jgi:hypothetical protein